MSDVELITQAQDNTALANSLIREIVEIGEHRPVPAQLITRAAGHLRNAHSAMISLEQRALGVKPPKVGD